LRRRFRSERRIGAPGRPGQGDHQARLERPPAHRHPRQPARAERRGGL